MSSQENKPPGTRGLLLIENSNYLNSVVQCLSNIQPLTDYFLSGKHETGIIDNSLRRKDEVAKSFGEIIKQLWSTKCDAVDPSDFQKTFASVLNNDEESHVPEFAHVRKKLSLLLGVLNKDLGHVTNKHCITRSNDEVGKSQLDDAIEIAKILANRKLCNDSIIMDLFVSLFQTTLVCTKCSKYQIMLDPDFHWFLPLPMDVTDDIKTYCIYCKDFEVMTKKVDLLYAPEVLIIVLDRVLFKFHSYEKIQSFVEFPIEKQFMKLYREFDLSPWIVGDKPPSSVYDLVAVLNHFGSSPYVGNFVTFAKNKFTGHWYSFTDDDVTKIDETDIVTNGAYILFYIRRKCHENEAVLDDEIKDLQVSSK